MDQLHSKSQRSNCYTEVRSQDSPHCIWPPKHLVQRYTLSHLDRMLVNISDPVDRVNPFDPFIVVSKLQVTSPAGSCESSRIFTSTARLFLLCASSKGKVRNGKNSRSSKTLYGMNQRDCLGGPASDVQVVRLLKDINKSSNPVVGWTKRPMRFANLFGCFLHLVKMWPFKFHQLMQTW